MTSYERWAFDAIFGTPDWFQQFYRVEKAEDIFGQPLEAVVKRCDFKSIGAFYGARLKSVFAGVAAKSIVWRNSRDAPLFQFFFAAANPRGAQRALGIAEDILKEGTPWG